MMKCLKLRLFLLVMIFSQQALLGMKLEDDEGWGSSVAPAGKKPATPAPKKPVTPEQKEAEARRREIERNARLAKFAQPKPKVAQPAAPTPAPEEKEPGVAEDEETEEPGSDQPAPAPEQPTPQPAQATAAQIAAERKAEHEQRLREQREREAQAEAERLRKEKEEEEKKAKAAAERKAAEEAEKKRQLEVDLKPLTDFVEELKEYASRFQDAEDIEETARIVTVLMAVAEPLLTEKLAVLSEERSKLPEVKAAIESFNQALMKIIGAISDNQKNKAIIGREGHPQAKVTIVNSIKKLAALTGLQFEYAGTIMDVSQDPETARSVALQEFIRQTGIGNRLSDKQAGKIADEFVKKRFDVKEARARIANILEMLQGKEEEEDPEFQEDQPAPKIYDSFIDRLSNPGFQPMHPVPLAAGAAPTPPVVVRNICLTCREEIKNLNALDIKNLGCHSRNRKAQDHFMHQACYDELIGVGGKLSKECFCGTPFELKCVQCQNRIPGGGIRPFTDIADGIKLTCGDCIHKTCADDFIIASFHPVENEYNNMTNYITDCPLDSKEESHPSTNIEDFGFTEQKVSALKTQLETQILWAGYARDNTDMMTMALALQPGIINSQFDGKRASLLPDYLHQALISTNRDQKTLLHLAAAQGNQAMTRFLLDQKEIALNARDAFNRTPLYIAVWHKHRELFDILYNRMDQQQRRYAFELRVINPQNRQQNDPDHKDFTLIHVAVYNSDDAMFKKLLPLYNDLKLSALATDPLRGRSLIDIAWNNQQTTAPRKLAMIQALLEAKCVQMQDATRTALRNTAFGSDNAYLVDFFIETTNDPNVRSQLLFQALKTGKVTTVKRLIDLKVPVDKQPVGEAKSVLDLVYGRYQEESANIYESGMGYIPNPVRVEWRNVIENLFQANASRMNPMTRAGILEIACDAGSSALIIALCKNENKKPIDVAYEEYSKAYGKKSGWLALIKKLLRSDKDMSSKTRQGLLGIPGIKDTELAKSLIDDMTMNEKIAACNAAITQIDLTRVMFWLENGVSLQNVDHKCLVNIFNNGWTDLAHRIIDSKTPLGIVGEEGNTSLHMAAKRGLVALVKNLIAKKLNLSDATFKLALNAKNNNGLTALDLAWIQCTDEYPRGGATLQAYREIAHALIDAGATVMSEEEIIVGASWSGVTIHPLTQAIDQKEEKIAGILLENKAVQASVKDRPEFLIKAVSTGSLALVKKLLALDANVNAVNDRFEAPIHLAVFYGHENIVKQILDTKKADLTYESIAINYAGTTPLGYCDKRDTKATLAIAKMLIAAGADVSTFNVPSSPAQYFNNPDVINFIAACKTPAALRDLDPLIASLGTLKAKLITLSQTLSGLR